MIILDNDNISLPTTNVLPGKKLVVGRLKGWKPFILSSTLVSGARRVYANKKTNDWNLKMIVSKIFSHPILGDSR